MTISKFTSAFGKQIPFIDDLGVEFLGVQNGQARVALDLQPRHLNSWEVAHGGVIMALLDVAMAVAGCGNDPEAGGGVTVEMKTSFLQPGHAGARLIATGTAFHRSTTMAFCEGEVRDQDDRLLAKAIGTFKTIARRDVAKRMAGSVTRSHDRTEPQAPTKPTPRDDTD